MRLVAKKRRARPLAIGAGRGVDHLAHALVGWFREHARELPWRQTRDPYAIWVSEVMLQQTQVRTVLPYYERWMAALPDLESLAQADAERIHKLWEGLGYYTRVRNMQAAARQILGEHQGKFPSQFEVILDLPGIGRYTAGAIASIAFGQPVPILDGNVIRVLARIFAVEGDPRDKAVNGRLWELARGLVEAAAATCPASARRDGDTAPHLVCRRSACGDLNESLMELGALVCGPRDPACESCPVANHCRAFKEKRVGDLPTLVARVAATPRRFFAFIAARKSRYLVRQRAAGTVNGHLWEFPNVEVSGETPAAAAAALFGCRSFKMEELITIRHTITRYRITLRAFRIAVENLRPGTRAGQRWVTAGELEQLAFPSAHRKIVRALLR